MDNVVSHVETVHRVGFANPKHRRQTEADHAQDQLLTSDHAGTPHPHLAQIRVRNEDYMEIRKQSTTFIAP